MLKNNRITWLKYCIPLPLLIVIIVILIKIFSHNGIEYISDPRPAPKDLFNRIFSKNVINFYSKDNREGIVGKVLAIESDGEGNIYILDEADSDIKKFNSEGMYLLTIGKKGKGPGEMLLGIFSYLSNFEEQLYVIDLGNGRINIYSRSDGSFVDSFLNSLYRPVFLKAGSDGKIFILSYRFRDNRVIHVYDSEGINLLSFGDLKKYLKIPKRFITKIPDHSEGSLDIDDAGNIYYSPQAPLINYVFSPDGDLIKTFSRKCSFNRLPDWTKRDRKFPYLQKGKLVLNKYYFNVIKIREGNKRTILDIYDLEGNLIVSDIVLPDEVDDIWIRFIDRKGNLFFTTYLPDSADPVLLKYSYNMEAFSEIFPAE